MDSDDSHPGTLSPRSDGPVTSSLKRKITPSSNLPRKRLLRTKPADTKVLSTPTTPKSQIVARTLTPPVTPARPAINFVAVAAAPPPIAIITPTIAEAPTSIAALLIDNSNNPLSVNRFKNLVPVLHAINAGPLKLRFPGVSNPNLFVITGLLRSHDMTIVKEGTELRDQLQSKSTLTLSLVDAETFATCVGDQMNAINTWIAAQPGFQPVSGKLFRSPYDEFAFTVDLTWAQYERTLGSGNTRSKMERRPGITMRKKERLDPVQYNDDGVAITLSWDDVKINSILHAEVSMTAYKDEKNRAYAGWTLDVSSILLVRGPIGDLPKPDNMFLETAEIDAMAADSGQKMHSHLRF